MANQYSDWWASQTAGLQGTLLSPVPKLEWGVSNRHYKRSYALLALSNPSVFDDGDVCRMMRLKATDRIASLLISSSGASTVITVDVGLYLPGTNVDGAVIDADEFVVANAINGAQSRVDVLLLAGATLISRRGAPLWEIAGYASLIAAIAAGASEMDVCLTATAGAAVTTADEPVMLEATGSFS